MDIQYYTDQEYDQIDFRKQMLTPGKYESSVFRTCILSELDLSHFEFMDCEFIDCDLSNSQVQHTAFKGLTFKDCKLIGIQFEDANPFLLSIHFEGCNLDFATFVDMKLKKFQFEGCKLYEADFTGADLTGLTLSECNLDKTIFSNTTLDKVDFRTAYNFNINPEINSFKKARFTAHGLMGLLANYQIIVD